MLGPSSGPSVTQCHFYLVFIYASHAILLKLILGAQLRHQLGIWLAPLLHVLEHRAGWTQVLIGELHAPHLHICRALGARQSLA